MEAVKLSPRLLAAARFVRPGSRVIDVGTDHGLIPAFLILNGVSPRVYASDIVPGPLARARETAERYGLGDRVSFHLGDGLEGRAPEEADDILIAGMGGEAIAGILERAPWTRDKRLILQPMSKHERLRGWLWANGYAILAEEYVRDAGNLYCVLLAEGGGAVYHPTRAELLVGRGGHPPSLYREYVDRRIEKLRHAVDGLNRSSSGRDSARLEALCAALGELENRRE